MHQNGKEERCPEVADYYRRPLVVDALTQRIVDFSKIHHEVRTPALPVPLQPASVSKIWELLSNEKGKEQHLARLKAV